jgi:uncharacterized protein YkvS
MYFSVFPQTLYSNDDRKTVKVITNILLRTVLTDKLKESFAAFDEYDVRDGDTPEILAFKLYGDSQLHWIILMFNDIFDPMFGWPLESRNLYNFVEGKYNDALAIHHYVDNNQRVVNANVQINSNTTLNDFNVGNVIKNRFNNGIAYITNKPNNNSIIITTTEGGFKSQDQFTLVSNANVVANVTTVTNIVGTPVTNLAFETEENEAKRRIKLLKPRFVQSVINEIELRLSQVNG